MVEDKNGSDFAELTVSPRVKTFSRFGFWFPFITLLSSMLVIGTAAVGITLIGIKLNPEIIGVLSMAMYLVWVAGAIIAWKINKIKIKEVFNFKKITPNKVLLSLGVAFAAQLAGILVGELITNLTGQKLEGNTTEILNKDMPSALIIIGVFTALLFAPICEEILFRGLILDGFINTSRKIKFKEGWAIGVSVVLSSVLFGLAHLTGFTLNTLMTFFVTGLFGAWLAFIRIRTGSLSLNILTHIFFNLSAVILIFLF